MHRARISGVVVLTLVVVLLVGCTDDAGWSVTFILDVSPEYPMNIGVPVVGPVGVEPTTLGSRVPRGASP